MSTHKNANDTLIDVAQGLQEHMDHKEARSNVIIAKNRMQTFNEYAFLFATNLNSIIIQYNLSRRDIMVVLKLIEYMYFGNLLSFSNTKLAKDLNLDPSNCSKILKRLKKTELIVEDEGNLYFNPHIACKGTLDERIPQDRRLIDYSAFILDKYESSAIISIATPNTRKKVKESERTSKEVIDKKIEEYFKE